METQTTLNLLLYVEMHWVKFLTHPRSDLSSSSISKAPIDSLSKNVYLAIAYSTGWFQEWIVP